jgi:CheY-like chemotaxis protein
MSRVLILDDDENRHYSFRRRFATLGFKPEDLIHVYTARQAIDALTVNERFDLVCLDHDLDPVSLLSDTGTGADVSEFIGMHMEPTKRPKLVLVHSWNPDGSARMVADLQAGNVRVIRREFSPSLLWLRFGP